MKAVSTLLALLWHLLLGIGRLLLSIVSTTIVVVGILVLVVKIVIRRLWRLFSKGYQSTWNALYARIGKPVCEICKHPKAKGRMVTHSDCCNRWVHDDCHASEAVAHMINEGATVQAAAAFKLAQAGRAPLAMRTLISSLRELRGDPYRPALFQKIARAKKLSTGMSLAEALLIMAVG